MHLKRQQLVSLTIWYVSSKSDEKKESYVGCNIQQCYYKEAAILDIHEAL